MNKTNEFLLLIEYCFALIIVIYTAIYAKPVMHSGEPLSSLQVTSLNLGKRGSSVSSFHTAEGLECTMVDVNDSETSSVGVEFFNPPQPNAKQKRVLFSVRTWPKSLMISNGSIPRMDQSGFSPKNRDNSETTSQSTVTRTPVERLRRQIHSGGSSTSILNTVFSKSVDSSNQRFAFGRSASFDELNHYEGNNMTDNDSVNHFDDDIGGI